MDDWALQEFLAAPYYKKIIASLNESSYTYLEKEKESTEKMKQFLEEASLCT